ncbi:tetratricopeptide repeat protein [Sphingomonas sp.]|uniref:tetratricopeptide repeat protein n=1 Tax=Sphingomonas sp. TaxID=28214 RepID=UPI001EB1E2BC|nr:tetratricopeptide repeat protein [Sphingomonas sp.]MBX3594661.1 tetratricopeptide repeat protein [Sphingomonas sp.]
MRIVLALALAVAPFGVAQAQSRQADPYAHAEILKGDYQQAERRLVAEQRIFPSMPEVLLNLAAVYSNTGRPDQARALYNKVLALDPVDMTVAGGEIAPSHLVAHRGLALIAPVRQAAR